LGGGEVSAFRVNESNLCPRAKRTNPAIEEQKKGPGSDLGKWTGNKNYCCYSIYLKRKG